VQIDACPQCRGLVRLRADADPRERLLTGDAARPGADAVLTT
jgi:Zn-finger nucleic acid-binding protein